jgi:two-component system chemotaxis response regulator CheB
VRAFELIAVGASWGGLRALQEILAGLPADFPPAIVVAQHRSADAQRGALVSALGSRSPLPVCEAGDKDPIRGGRVHVSPPDYHLLVEGDGFALSVDEPVRFSRPSIDVLLESAADAYGARMIGLILTGASADGAAGLALVRDRGGMTIVQDPGTAERTEMPEAAIAAGAAQHVVPLAGIAPLLVESCGRQAAGRTA